MYGPLVSYYVKACDFVYPTLSARQTTTDKSKSWLRAFFLLVFYFLNNNICASADQQPCTYNPEHTKKMQHLVKIFEGECLYGRTGWTNFWRTAFKTPEDSEVDQIIELIKKGADPKKLLFSMDPFPLATALRFYNPKITELCLHHGIDHNNQQKGPRNTPLHVHCRLISDYGKNYEGFLKKLALLRFYNADLNIKNPDARTPRDVLLQTHHEAVTDFDAIMRATDVVRNLKKQETNNARLPLLLRHLPDTVADTVNSYSDDAFWDETSWPALQEHVASTRSEKNNKQTRSHARKVEKRIDRRE